jgi:hypothetical protein
VDSTLSFQTQCDAMTEFFLIGYGGPLMNHGRKKKKGREKVK